MTIIIGPRHAVKGVPDCISYASPSVLLYNQLMTSGRVKRRGRVKRVQVCKYMPLSQLWLLCGLRGLLMSSKFCEGLLCVHLPVKELLILLCNHTVLQVQLLLYTIVYSFCTKL